MNHTTPQNADIFRDILTEYHPLPPLAFLDLANMLTRQHPSTRVRDWVVALQYGPVTLYQVLEGGPVSFTKPLNRHIVIYPVKQWPKALARCLWGRLFGRWSGVRGSSHA